MSSASTPIPVVVCGRSTAIGKPVSESLLPEIEVIHFIQTNEAAIKELPLLLAGQDPQSTDDNGVGSHQYGRPVRAVIFGRGYGIDDIESFKAACEGAALEPVGWIAGDPAKAPAPGAPPPGPDYFKTASKLTKEAVFKWVESGAGKDQVILY
ncbi:hypothetical protein N7478_003119 [Penicillium angulare]|uniref:uncharacterized protein n=1 Tax=Penicillium angulare TaxID=116970 RepID=UPI00254056DF|nr:uncharacterized protein N7478_003119 [Penicillium angulare]KAJ5287433.1 hypothetical protein N7478_003119 [Penicillium angulare]